jgi:hypothetical protein
VRCYFPHIEEELKMKRFLVVLVLLMAALIGLGFYLGWFDLSTQSTGQKTYVTVTVDRKRIREDAKTAKEKVQDVGQKVKEKIGAGTQKSKDESPQQ